MMVLDGNYVLLFISSFDKSLNYLCVCGWFWFLFVCFLNEKKENVVIWKPAYFRMILSLFVEMCVAVLMSA